MTAGQKLVFFINAFKCYKLVIFIYIYKYSAIILLFREEYIALAILRLVELEKAIVEGAGATGLAAILEGLLPELEGKK